MPWKWHGLRGSLAEAAFHFTKERTWQQRTVEIVVVFSASNSKRSPSVSLQISSPHFTNQMLAVSLHASMALCFVQRSDFFDKAAKRAAKATRFSVASYGSYGSGKFEPQKKQVAGHGGPTKTNVLKCQPAEYTCMKLHAGKSLFSWSNLQKKNRKLRVALLKKWIGVFCFYFGTLGVYFQQ